MDEKERVLRKRVAEATLVGTDYEVVERMRREVVGIIEPEPTSIDMLRRLEVYYGKRVKLGQARGQVATVHKLITGSDGTTRYHAQVRLLAKDPPDNWVVDAGTVASCYNLTFDEAVVKFCQVVDVAIAPKEHTLDDMLKRLQEHYGERVPVEINRGAEFIATKKPILADRLYAIVKKDLGEEGEWEVDTGPITRGLTYDEAFDKFCEFADQAINEICPEVVYGIKLLREDWTSLGNKHLTFRRIHYPLGEEIEVPGNGSYVALEGEPMAGGWGPILVVVACKEPTGLGNMGADIQCFRKVKALSPIILNLEKISPSMWPEFSRGQIADIANLGADAREWILEKL